MNLAPGVVATGKVMVADHSAEDGTAAADRLTTAGYAAYCPLRSDTDPNGGNGRVEFKVTAHAKA